jgi:hypothetical protein
MPQSPQQAFTDVQPIPQRQSAPKQTFSNITPLSSQPSVWDVLTQPTDKTDQEYTRYTGPAGVAGATIKGLDDVARGALSGTWNTVRHPIDTAKSIADLPSQAAQVPAAIRDINASPDPTGTYLNAAQDTASQGAGQALVALAVPPVARGAISAVMNPGKVLRSVGVIAKPLGVTAEDLPVVGSVVKGIKAIGKIKGELEDIWKPNDPALAQSGALAHASTPAATPAAETGEALGTIKSGSTAGAFKDPGAPLPETPSPQLLQAHSLFEGSSSPPDPAAGLWTVKQSSAPAAGIAGQIADSMRKPVPSAEVAPGLNRGSLQDLLDKSLGAKKLDPKVPLRQQMPATSGTSVSTAPVDAAASLPSAEPEHMGQFARANGLELHQAIPETVEGDVLRAKIHGMSNVQVRQLAINSGVDMGQMPVTNAKSAGGVTRQQALKWVMMNRTPEEIGAMIDQGQHLPGPPSGAISNARAISGNLK